MKRKLKKIFSNKLVLTIVSLLIFLWVISSLVFINKVSFSVVTYQSRNIDRPEYSSADLCCGKVFSGEFKALDNYLGLIILELDPRRISEKSKEDKMIFKFREVGEKSWTFQREYNMGLFDSQSSFSFGIPQVSDSGNKTYEFEISSTTQDKKNNVVIKNTRAFVSGYQYPKSAILGGNTQTMQFIFSKTVGSFSDPSFILMSTVYLAPLGSFILILLALENMKFKLKLEHVKSKAKVKFKKKYLRVMTLLFIILGFLISLYFKIDGFFILIFLWFLAVKKFKFKSSISFVLSFTLIIFWMIIIPLGLQSLQNKLNVWSFTLLALSMLQLFFEIKKNEKKKS